MIRIIHKFALGLGLIISGLILLFYREPFYKILDENIFSNLTEEGVFVFSGTAIFGIFAYTLYEAVTKDEDRILNWSLFGSASIFLCVYIYLIFTEVLENV